MPDIPILTEATFERLLNRGHYGIIGNQLLFFSQELGQFVLTQISEEQAYTAADYAKLPESAPFQLINGKLIFMASPKDLHQQIVGNIYFEIRSYIKIHKIGELRVSPLDVHFDEQNIVQPDVLFVSIARKEIIQDYIKGAPDFVVEVLSPTNTKAEMQAKMELYGKYDVIEYWIVKPKEESVEVYHNHAQQMQLFVEAGIEDTIKSVAIEGFELEVRRIFE
jgi:Uma2 family endonuclease